MCQLMTLHPVHVSSALVASIRAVHNLVHLSVPLLFLWSACLPLISCSRPKESKSRLKELLYWATVNDPFKDSAEDHFTVVAGSTLQNSGEGAAEKPHQHPATPDGLRDGRKDRSGPFRVRLLLRGRTYLPK